MDIVQKLEKIFDAKRVIPHLDDAEDEFLQFRSKLVSSFPFFLSMNEYLQYHDLFKKYGLQDEMLKRVEHEIWYKSKYNPMELSKSEFYKRFKDKRIVRKHFDISKLPNKLKDE